MFLSHLSDATGNPGLQLVSWCPIKFLTWLLESFYARITRTRGSTFLFTLPAELVVHVGFYFLHIGRVHFIKQYPFFPLSSVND